jgi:DNA-binding NtrC family response regulator
MNSGRQAVEFFLNKKPVNDVYSHEISVMLLDLSMPDVDGLSVLKQIANTKGDLQVIVLTATNEIYSAVAAMNLGAMDYIINGEKDIFARIVASINSAIEKKNLKQQVYNLERTNNHRVSFSDLIGESKIFLNTISLAKKVTNSNVPVLIEGAIGSGKELLARAIHGNGTRSGKPFVYVNCESLEAHSADLTLFGREQQNSNMPGRILGKIREADGGTLLLDNIHMLRSDIQIKLLRFIQEGEIEPVDSRSAFKVNVRIISSTARDLETLVRHDRFREDLFYCLNVFLITIPSLSQRGSEDIKLIAESFCRNFSVSENKKIKNISPEALKMLSSFDWEDNIRQLRNYVFRAVVLCDDDELQPKHFPQVVNSENFKKIRKKLLNSVSRKTIDPVEILHHDGVCKNMEEIEKEVVEKLLDFHDGNLSEASKQLKVGRSTIYRKLRPE